MTLANAPFEVAYPVKFYSEGDTTKDAFGKHIQEIERIYGLLNALNADKLSVDVFNNIHNAHVNSSNPHPNLDLGNTKGSLATSRLSGNLPFSRIDGSLDLSRTTGNLDGSRVTGTLSNANIGTGGINGLESYVKGIVEANAGGIKTTSKGAYMYAGDVLLQWGSVHAGEMSNGETKSVTVNLPKPYKTANEQSLTLGSTGVHSVYEAFSQTGNSLHVNLSVTGDYYSSIGGYGSKNNDHFLVHVKYGEEGQGGKIISVEDVWFWWYTIGIKP